MSETITLNAIVVDGGSAVDTVYTHDGNPVHEDKTGSKLLPNQARYIGPDHGVGLNIDQFILSRTFPKSNGVFRGVLRPGFKKTKTVNVEQSDGTTKDVTAFLEVSGSIPVGISDNDRIELVNHVAAFLGLSAIVPKWLTNAKIENF